MPHGPRGLWREVRRYAGSILAACVLTVAGCDKGTQNPAGPDLPPDPPDNPQVTATAFIFDVDMRSGKVKVFAPTKGLDGLAPGVDGPSRSLTGPNRSLLGGDVIELVTSAYAVTSGGGFPSGTIPVGPCPGGSPAGQTGRLCVEFDVAIINELLGVQLVGPQVFPTPPAGTTGPLMFPYNVALVAIAGGVGTGGQQGNDVIITNPNSGEVTVSDEWNGLPHDFFNDVTCPVNPPSGTGQGTSDCFRFEEVTPSPVLGGAISDPKTVGFYVDPTVYNFQVRILVAADLQNQSGSASGSINGNVTAPNAGGALPNVDVTADHASLPDVVVTTDASGNYSFPTLGLGQWTLTLTQADLPAGCSSSPQSTTLGSNGEVDVVNFTVNCPVASGTINGTISSSLGGGIAGAALSITPGGGSSISTTSGAAGAYTQGGVPLGTPTGTGTVAITGGLPAGCTLPGPTPYTGLTNGGTITVDITVTCTPPPSAYFLRGTWSSAGGTDTYRLDYDLTQRDDPAIPGLDDIFVISGLTQFDNTRLTFVSSANVAGSLLQNQGSNLVAPNTVAWFNADTDAARATGVQGVILLNFTRITAGAVTPVTSFQGVDDVQSENGTDLKPNTVIQDATLP